MLHVRVTYPGSHIGQAEQRGIPDDHCKGSSVTRIGIDGRDNGANCPNQAQHAVACGQSSVDEQQEMQRNKGV